MKKHLKKIIPRRLKRPAQPEGVPSGMPRITNETIASHREEVLSSARKYIYPLQHSKHKVVLISTALFILVLVTFFTLCVLYLYRFKSTSGFLYGVTRVVPFPIAKVGPDYVAYENYLFEIRHYVHYYESQQRLDFNSDLGMQQLADYKKSALNKVIDDAMVKQLAKEHNVSVSAAELEQQIVIMREQNRLGANDKGFEDVLRDNFGWSVDDFRRSLRQQMLTQKVVSVLDTGARAKADAALAEIKQGKSFASVAKKYSDDAATKNNGGRLGLLIDRTNRDFSARTTDALFDLEAGEVSEVINTGYTLEIVKSLKKQSGRVEAARILINLKDISTYLNEIKDENQARLYVKL